MFKVHYEAKRQISKPKVLSFLVALAFNKATHIKIFLTKQIQMH